MIENTAAASGMSSVFSREPPPESTGTAYVALLEVKFTRESHVYVG